MGLSRCASKSRQLSSEANIVQQQCNLSAVLVQQTPVLTELICCSLALNVCVFAHEQTFTVFSRYNNAWHNDNGEVTTCLSATVFLH